MGIASLLIFGLLLGTSSIESSFIAPQYEETYQYVATMESIVEGVKTTTANKIEFELTAVNTASGILVQPQNGRYQINECHSEATTTAFPNEAKSLRLPFVIKEGENGTSILVYWLDELWSVNMKKALASMMQLDLSGANTTYKGAQTYTSAEYSTFGRCHVHYKIEPRTNEVEWLSVTKEFDPALCEGFAWKPQFSVNRDFWKPGGFPVSSKVSREYRVQLIEGSIRVDSVRSAQRIDLRILDASSGKNAFRVSQELSRKNHKKIDKLREYDVSDMSEYELTVNVDPQESDRYDRFLTGGRSKHSQDSIINEVFERYMLVLKRMSKTTQVDYADPNEYFLRIIQQLKSLDPQHLQILFDKIHTIEEKDSLRSLFLQSLPVAGTREAALFIRDLIVRHEFVTAEEQLVLEVLSTHIKHPSPELLEELMVLVNATEYYDSSCNCRRSTATLSLATIASKVIERYPNDASVGNFVEGLIDKFKSAKDERERVFYLSALKNTKSGRAIKLFERVIANDGSVEETSPYVRSLAIWACNEFHVKNAAFDLYWLILRGSRDNLEVKAAALDTLMTNADMDTLLQLHSIVKNDKDDELYALFYAKLQSVGKSETSCAINGTQNASKLLRTIPKPIDKKFDSLSYVLDFFDENCENGFMPKINLVGNLYKNNFTYLNIKFPLKVDNIKMNMGELYLRGSFREECKNIVKIPTGDNLKVSTLNCLFFEAISSNNDGITSIEKLHFTDIVPFVKRMFLPPQYTEIYHSIQTGVEGETVFPTDIGVPAVFFLHMHAMYRFEDKFDKYAEGPPLTYAFKLSSNNIYGMKLYNPIVDVWHGLRTVRATTANAAVGVRVERKQRGPTFVIYVADRGEKHKYEWEQKKMNQMLLEATFTGGSEINRPCRDVIEILPIPKERRAQDRQLSHDCELTDTVYRAELHDCSIDSPSTCSLRATATPKHSRLEFAVSRQGETTEFAFDFYGDEASESNDESKANATNSWSLRTLDERELPPELSEAIEFARTQPRRLWLCYANSLPRWNDATSTLTQHHLVYKSSGDDADRCPFDERPALNVTQPSTTYPKGIATRCTAAGLPASRCVADARHYRTVALEWDADAELDLQATQAAGMLVQRLIGTGELHEPQEDEGGANKKRRIALEYPDPLTDDAVATFGEVSFKVPGDTLEWPWTLLTARTDMPTLSRLLPAPWSEVLADARRRPCSVSVRASSVEGSAVVVLRGMNIRYALDLTEWRRMTADGVEARRNGRGVLELRFPYVWNNKDMQFSVQKPTSKIEVYSNEESLPSTDGYHTVDGINYKIKDDSIEFYGFSERFKNYLKIKMDDSQILFMYNSPIESKGMCYGS